METQKLIKLRIILEIITFSVVFLSAFNCFWGASHLFNARRHKQALKVYYLMDFRLFGAGRLHKGSFHNNYRFSI